MLTNDYFDRVMELSEKLQLKLDKLISYLQKYRIIVAFSGGVDSGLLAYLSNKYAKEVLLVTEESILYPENEIKLALEFSKKYNIPHMIFKRNPLNDIDFKKNPKNRCYICKTGLYRDIIEIKDQKGFDIILDGTNLDDLSDYRPGMKALEELSISRPYIEFKINKKEIREICEFFELEIKSKPSMACFSSRIPYEQEITEEKLNMIRNSEKFLREVFNLSQVRVRLHEGYLARIELLKEDFFKVFNSESFEKISQKFIQYGFCYVTIDLEGYRSGSLNEVLQLEEN